MGGRVGKQPSGKLLPGGVRSWGGRSGKRSPLRHCERRRGGFSVIEIAIVMTVLLVAFLAMSQSLGASMQLTRVNRETALADQGIQDLVEVMSGVEDFSTVFRLYNADAADDPGPGPAPGSGFAVEGLQPVEGDVDGLVGEIVFPTVGGQLFENIADPELGMPRDLNGDGGTDLLPHNDDYSLLPVLIRLRWQGCRGERMVVVRTLLSDR